MVPTQHDNDLTTGGCLCGQIRYSIHEAPDLVCFCHCTSCRKATGGAVVAWATFRESALRIDRGSLTLCETSTGVTRGHCARCGSSITYQHVRRHGEVDVTVASTDQPEKLRPSLHVWTQDKPTWLVIGDNLPQHERTIPADAFP
jgi:hypothetical protein